MIQRVQTLYLLIATIVASIAVQLFTDGLLLAISKRVMYKMFQVQTYFTDITTGLLIISSLISIVTIFLFKNRQSQLNLGKLNILINVLLLGLSTYHLLTLSGEISFSEKGIKVIISSVIVLVLVLLANRAIKKDEDLVKSVDRLR